MLKILLSVQKGKMREFNVFNLRILPFFVLFLSVSCNRGEFKVDETGLEYKFIQEYKENTKPKVGDILTLQFNIARDNGNIIEKTAVFRKQLDKPSHLGGSVEDALLKMHEGDSAVFHIDAYNFYTKTRKIPLPDSIEEGEQLTFYIKLYDITSQEEFEKERKMARVSDKREEERLLKDYLKRANINVEPSMSGLYFIEIKKGNGNRPVPGKMVTVNYKGYFVDGQVFDSSYDSGKPFSFVFGIGQVIQGLDEGVGKMREHGKYRLIIPSHLAYGERQQGPIPPNSTLIFDIELLQAEQ